MSAAKVTKKKSEPTLKGEFHEETRLGHFARVRGLGPRLFLFCSLRWLRHRVLHTCAFARHCDGIRLTAVKKGTAGAYAPTCGVVYRWDSCPPATRDGGRA